MNGARRDRLGITPPASSRLTPTKSKGKKASSDIARTPRGFHSARTENDNCEPLDFKIEAERLVLLDRVKALAARVSPRINSETIALDGGGGDVPHNPWESSAASPGRLAEKGKSNKYTEEAHSPLSKLAIDPRGGLDPDPAPSPIRHRNEASRRRRNVVKQYRPGYTWNRGGRLKELRIRCTARKFLYIWRTKTFGRVPLSAAQNHYRKKIISKMFGIWYDMWWETRKEWALSVRSELHNKFRLFNSVWNAWRQYTAENRVKTARSKVATNHANSRRLALTFKSWKTYQGEQKAKRIIKSHMDMVYAKNLLKRTWSTWTNRMSSVKQEDVNEQSAIQIHKLKTVNKVWMQWTSLIQRQRRLKIMSDIAGEHFNITLKRKCLDGLCTYANRRHEKIALQGKAEEFHEHRLTRQCLERWRDLYELAQQRTDHREQMAVLAYKSKCRRVFVQWRNYIGQVHMQNYEMEMAEQHHTESLMKTRLSMWKLFVVYRRTTKIKKQIADEYSRRRVLRFGWTLWQESLWEIEEKECAGQTLRARRHYRNRLMKKSFETLKLYLANQRHKRVLYAIADDHYKITNLPKMFHKFVEFRDIMRQKRDMSEKADHFKQFNAKAKFFYLWNQTFEKKKDLEMSRRMAVLQYNENLSKRFLSAWRNKTKDVMLMSHKSSIAEEHSQIALTSRMWNKWREYIAQARDLDRQEQEAERHHHSFTKKKVWVAWVKYTNGRREKACKMRKADEQYKVVVQRRMIRAWRIHINWWNRVSGYAASRFKEKQISKVQSLFCHWRANAQILAIDKEKTALAHSHWVHRAVNQVFITWHQWTVMKRWKHDENQTKLDIAKDHLNKVTLTNLFAKWKLATDTRVIDKLKEQKADSHYNYVCKRKTIVSMQNHVQIMLKKKVIVEWVEWTQRRRALAVRMKGALSVYNKHLQITGARKWLEVSTSMRASKLNMALHQGNQKYANVQLVVQRCAQHWLHVTRKNRISEREVVISAPQLNRQYPSTEKPQTVHHSTTELSNFKLSIPISASPKQPKCISRRHDDGSEKTTLSDSTNKYVRPSPRKPNFLLESLKRDGLLSSSSYNGCLIQNGNHELPGKPTTTESASDDTETVMKELQESGLTEETSTSLRPPPVIHSNVQVPQNDFKLLPPSAFVVTTTHSQASELVIDNSITQGHGAGRNIECNDKRHEYVEDKENKFQSPADEILTIRKQLRTFEECKLRLKESFQQRKTLTKWMDEQTASGIIDEHTLEVNLELNALNEDIKSLEESVSEKKPEIIRLLVRVDKLLGKKTTSECYST